MSSEKNEIEAWHLDKKVPISLIAVILIQTGGAIWWAAKVSERVDSIELRVSTNEVTNRRQYDRMNADRAVFLETSNRLARVEGLLESIEKQVSTVIAHIMKNNGKK